MTTEIRNLARNIEHIKEIVFNQQNYAKVIAVVETVELPALLEDALRFQDAAYDRHRIKLVKEFDPVPPILVDKHKVLQIVVNLLSNAKYACDAANKKENQVTVRLKNQGSERVKIEVEDTGIGISREHTIKIFSQGFTTRKGGHGFGLHSGALLAKELGGALNVDSSGPGKGATFSLELPLKPPQKGA